MSVSRVACLALLVVGCGGDKTAPTNSGSGGAADAGHHGQGNSTGGAPNDLDATTPLAGDASDYTSCVDAGASVPGAVCILHVNGRAIDETGAPVPKGSLVSACGPAQCNPGITDADGNYRIEVGLTIIPQDYSVQVHLRPSYAAFYFQLPENAPGPYIQLGSTRVLPMPTTGPSIVIDRAGAAAQSVTSGDVTLELGPSVYVRLDVESNLAGDFGKEFRTLRIPDAVLHEYAPLSTGIKVLYALEPFESSFEVGGQPNVPTIARLSFVNYAQFAAGSSVDLMQLGSYVFPDPITVGSVTYQIPPATFVKVATGHVSADGKTIDLDPGEGLPLLTWVGLRSTP